MAQARRWAEISHQGYGRPGLRPEAEPEASSGTLAGGAGSSHLPGSGEGGRASVSGGGFLPPLPRPLEASFRNCRIWGQCSAPLVRAPEESVLSCPSPVLFSLLDKGRGKVFSSGTFLSPRCPLWPFLHRGSVLAGCGVRAGVFCLLRLLLASPQSWGKGPCVSPLPGARKFTLSISLRDLFFFFLPFFLSFFFLKWGLHNRRRKLQGGRDIKTFVFLA